MVFGPNMTRNIAKNGHPASDFVSPPAESASNGGFSPRWPVRVAMIPAPTPLQCAVLGLLLLISACYDAPTGPFCGYQYSNFRWQRIDSASITWIARYDSVYVCST